ncbi:septum formation family protein [Nocardioides sp. CER19]|uniref:septum formation family protein n=1 Tax=Nocardioides sp. CER19 TaxID=3038538 RepID=UPI00244A3EE0|nr:septum formation family protein [Nocardioides sp. CER19]MDH2415528.1 septum formation family protein [Nocardioides sp. CER19]
MRPALLLLSLLLPLTLVAGCGGKDVPAGADPAQVDSKKVPTVGACRNLRRSDIAAPTNAGKLRPCTEPHNAETFASGELPAEFKDADYHEPDLEVWAYRACGSALTRHLGATDSVVMRAILSWVWFRPSQKAWDDGARWYRCDVIGGGAGSRVYLDLPTTTKDLMATQPDDHWMTCARGTDPDHGAKLPCSQQHSWRAVTVIKVGEPDDPYPGDAAVAKKSKSFCASSVAAWLGYPTDYDYAYTWFHAPEWKAGNRKSVCWAKTAQ